MKLEGEKQKSQKDPGLLILHTVQYSSKQIRKLISNLFLFWHGELSLFEDWHRLMTFWGDYMFPWTTGYETIHN